MNQTLIEKKLFEKRREQSLTLFRKSINYFTLILFFTQIILNLNFENVICNLICVTIIFQTNYEVINVRNRSIDSALIAVLVYLIIICNSLMPMMGTVIEGNELIFSLKNPIEVFSHRYFFGLVLLVAFKLTHRNKSSSLYILFNKLGSLFETRKLVSIQTLWALGFLGIMPLLLRNIISNIILIKFIEGFGFLIWAPFLLLITPYSNIRSKSDKLGLIIFMAIMLAISIIVNSRMAIVGPIATILCAWLITLLMGYANISQASIKKGALIGISSIFVLGQISDLSTAILIERAYRYNRTADEQLSITFDTYLNKEKIAEFSKSEKNLDSVLKSDGEWQENYIRNPFLARLTQIKYDDNCFERIKTFTPEKKVKLEEITVDKLLSNFPSPVLDFLNINVDKKYSISFSVGDIIDVLSGKGFLGGLKTGSVIAHAFVIFSWSYLLILLIIYYIIFTAFQGLVTFTKFEVNDSSLPFSTLGLFICFKLFTDISLDGITSPVGFLFRGIWQLMFIYFVAIKLVFVFDKKK